MATFAPFIHVISIILVLYLYSGFCSCYYGGADTNRFVLPQKSWCVALNESKPEELKKTISRICGGEANCSPIQKGGECFLPDNVYNHASFAMNLDYQLSGRDPQVCAKMRYGIIVDEDPSYDNCHFVSD
ncbi:hypothetical protein ACOSP7_008690 [Xanthoceras sorbifolium]